MTEIGNPPRMFDQFRNWARAHEDPASNKGMCQYCGRPTLRVAANGKPCCSACDDLPGREAL